MRANGSRQWQRGSLFPPKVSPRLQPRPQVLPHQAWWKRFRPEHRLLTGSNYRRLKRLLDLLLLALSAPFTLPLLSVLILVTKLEYPYAPALFTQMRTGKDGYRFRMYKLRTMVPDAEALKNELAHLNELEWPDFKISEDPRITRLGRILRRTSLDELPQLFNIVKGEMSLVGPRPTSFHPDTYKLWHTERLEVVPGLTGLWQVVGRGSMEFDDRVRLDIDYVRRRSVLLDFTILMRTVTSVVKQEGAY